MMTQGTQTCPSIEVSNDTLILASISAEEMVFCLDHRKGSRGVRKQRFKVLTSLHVSNILMQTVLLKLYFPIPSLRCVCVYTFP